MTDPERFAWLDDVPVEIEANISGPLMRLSDILALRAGAIVSTPRQAGTTVSVFAGGARLGDGELSSDGSRTVIRMAHFGGKG